jgi:hypothetical protein
MKQIMKIVAVLLLMVGLTGFCTGSGVDELENVLSEQIGSTNDQWLEKQSARDPTLYDRVAVVFGMDDEKACAAIAQALLDAHGERWRCTPAN